ncbi:MAG: YgfZ/GcvT domain-containing protein [Burkholderiales bacterium]
MTPTLHALDQFGLLAFTGPEARAFLHGQLSCDVEGLAPDAVTPGSYSTPKGRMLATFLLWTEADDVRLLLPRALCEPVRKRLAMFILRAKVKAEDATAQHRLYGLQAGDPAPLLAPLGIAAPAHAFHVATAGGRTALRLDAERVLLVTPAGSVSGAAPADPLATAPADTGAWALADIRGGLPWILPETQEQFVPQTANLDLIGGVSFTKGCYPGQEIVARMHYLGRLKERLLHAHVDAPPPAPGTRLYSAAFGAQAAGTVVNAAADPAGGSELLAVAQLAAAGDLALAAPDGPRLRPLPLPYPVPA